MSGDTSLAKAQAKDAHARREFSTAVALFRVGLSEDSHDSECWDGLVECLQKTGQFREAIDSARDGLRILPDNHDLRLSLSRLLAATGDVYEAAYQLTTAATNDIRQSAYA